MTRWAWLPSVAALAGVAGCGSQAGHLFFQTTSAAGRTIVDLVLTSYANFVVSVLAAF